MIAKWSLPLHPLSSCAFVSSIHSANPRGVHIAASQSWNQTPHVLSAMEGSPSHPSFRFIVKQYVILPVLIWNLDNNESKYFFSLFFSEIVFFCQQACQQFARLPGTWGSWFYSRLRLIFSWSINQEINIELCVRKVKSSRLLNTKKYHVFAPMGRFQLESIYLYFPPSSQLLYLCFCPVGLSLL